MAFGFAVYASQCGLLQPHARLASSCWSGSTGRDPYPQGSDERFQSCKATSHSPFPSLLGAIASASADPGERQVAAVVATYFSSHGRKCSRSDSVARDLTARVESCSCATNHQWSKAANRCAHRTKRPRLVARPCRSDQRRVMGVFAPPPAELGRHVGDCGDVEECARRGGDLVVNRVECHRQ